MRRLLDFSLALALFLPYLVFTALLSILILAIDGFSPFHIQKRIGKNGVFFTCFKLQTMKPAQNKSVVGEREKDELRLTKLGEFLRDHGWDEVPQLLNILLGKMSFVGPRPLLLKTIERIKEKNPDILEKVSYWEEERKKFLPGISGWHQIQIGKRSSIIDCDLEYLKYL